MKFIAWLLVGVAGLAVLPFALLFFLALACSTGLYRLFRWAELVIVFRGDTEAQARAHWRAK